MTLNASPHYSLEVELIGESPLTEVLEKRALSQAIPEVGVGGRYRLTVLDAGRMWAGIADIVGGRVEGNIEGGGGAERG